jgi:hypothetical protein
MLEGNLFKIKEGKIDIWKEWCNELNTSLRNDAIATLKEEGNVQEVFVVFELNGDFYTIGLAEGQNLPATNKEINIKHKAISKECLEKIGKVSCLYNLIAN